MTTNPYFTDEDKGHKVMSQLGDLHFSPINTGEKNSGSLLFVVN